MLPRTSPRGVLVVEPDPDLQHKFARWLTVAGNRVVGTSSGDGALALAARWPVDLAFVAEDLPGMDGLEVVRRLLDLRPSTRVILLATEDGPEVQQAARVAGARACARKPRRGDRLIDLIVRLDGEEPVAAAE
ncbi:MAG: response regulator [Sandaracinus sp.]|nr:response regulator [Myxococcales bacterium]MCB9615802.1 response regulator [Sandaracinus sp.]MCB9622282.1 response regulator [Sandaracinus sp.]MCB9634516.1 response regulator [Sandaracinus sp.]